MNEKINCQENCEKIIYNGSENLFLQLKCSMEEQREHVQWLNSFSEKLLEDDCIDEDCYEELFITDQEEGDYESND